MIVSLRHLLGWMLNARRSQEEHILENLIFRFCEGATFWRETGIIADLGT